MPFNAIVLLLCTLNIFLIQHFTFLMLGRAHTQHFSCSTFNISYADNSIFLFFFYSFDKAPKVYPYDNLKVELGGEP
jgi:hypothetical protein